MMYWLSNLLYEIEWWLTDRIAAIKHRIRPDRRPDTEIIAEVKARLRQMPAGKEVHEALGHLEAGWPDKKDDQ